MPGGGGTICDEAEGKQKGTKHYFKVGLAFLLEIKNIVTPALFISAKVHICTNFWKSFHFVHNIIIIIYTSKIETSSASDITADPAPNLFHPTNNDRL